MNTTLIASDLPAAPPLEHWVLEQPIPLAAAAICCGIAAFVLLARRGDTRRGAIAGGVMVALGVSVLAIGLSVETQREHLAGLTRDFIAAVFTSDADRADSLLSDALVIASGGVIYESLGKSHLVEAVRHFENFGTQEWKQRPRASASDGPNAGRAQATIHVRAAYLGSQSMPSTWEFTWRRTPDGPWRVVRLECLTMWGQPPAFSWDRDVRAIGSMIRGGRPAGGLKPDAF